MQHLIKFIFLCISTYTFACDICSCASGANNQMNMEGKKNIFGLNYNYISFKFRDGVHKNSPYGWDDIHQINLSGQFTVHKKIDLQIFIPFQTNVRATEEEQIKNSGIGDILANAILTILDRKKHKIQSGIGIKLPTGTFNYNVATTTNTSALQLGTGSWDFNLPLEYRYVNKRFTTKIKGTYFYKTVNQDRFKFGNQTQIQWLNSYKFLKRKHQTIGVNMGVSYDDYQESEIRGNPVLKTNGYLLTTNLGLTAHFKKITIGTSYQIPIKQNLIEKEVHFNKGASMYAYYNF